MSTIATSHRRTVVGLGVTGLSVARYLAARGLPFSLADSRSAPPGLAEIQAEFPNVSIALGEFSLEQFIGEQELFVNPGIPLSQPAIAAAAQAGAIISGDLDCFAEAVNAPVIAITGSNGKSTVTTLVGEMAERAGLKVAVGGNLGTPMLDLLDDAVELYVLELSSFQLERSHALKATVATVLNVSADHLDHHGSMVNYHQAKHRIFRNCEKVVINADEPLSNPLIPEDVERWYFSLGKSDFRRFGLVNENGQTSIALVRKPLLAVNELKIAGRHNMANAMAALALGSAVGLDIDAMLEALREFPGLQHRCAYVAEINGVSWFNDSKGTNAGAAIAALEGLAERGKIVLIAGGQAKGADLRPLVDAMLRYCSAAVLIGEAAEEIEKLLATRLPSLRCENMSEAVSTAAAFAKPGELVLLSPACASFDMFNGYVDRGNQFEQAVNALANKSETQEVAQ
ncbi:UDP-N-acetylmuramoyl-L-alanine--D-glutamate ligase [Spongiibacter sp. KMU-158]|uniref:UDP-N-acetylmuramoylalanine--D-glutamate ligase n=1 Tax=Spongiibacter pelagi TaxID=2760804 RepID=A0A927C1V1_9GAMM|nr:UDP-N-acetylmuramoyl-L-alanine--D-glutamate ligase [Spongiibacter pelagi]MBD2859738.1 UDP-N-acetylmuramoyl-L-alanine--D-glutamate ligase [Spongiibacter pelagi]